MLRKRKGRDAYDPPGLRRPVHPWKSAGLENVDVLASLGTTCQRFRSWTSVTISNRALEALSEDVKNYLWHDPEFPWLGAGIYSLMNEKEEALRWLEHAINRGWINYPLFNEQDPFYENIRGEKRFKEQTLQEQG